MCRLSSFVFVHHLTCNLSMIPSILCSLSLSYAFMLATVALCQVVSTTLPLTAVPSRLSVALRSPSLSVQSSLVCSLAVFPLLSSVNISTQDSTHTHTQSRLMSLSDPLVYDPSLCQCMIPLSSFCIVITRHFKRLTCALFRFFRVLRLSDKLLTSHNYYKCHLSLLYLK